MSKNQNRMQVFVEISFFLDPCLKRLMSIMDAFLSFAFSLRLSYVGLQVSLPRERLLCPCSELSNFSGSLRNLCEQFQMLVR